jgi:hypothetical protein
MADSESGGSPSLTARERGRLDVLRSAESLGDLKRLTGAESEHDAYLDAKAEWQRLRRKELGEPEQTDGLPGDRVVVNGTPIHVHGITHANTDPERSFLRGHVTDIREAGGTVYCEQGIRPMYFEDMDDVCEIDDYRWAMYHCRERNLDSHVPEYIEQAFGGGLGADLQSVVSRFREVTFSLIESGSEVYGERFAAALGDVASDFLMTHEQIATGENFDAFQKSRAAARDPSKLPALQQYYRQVFLPQPIEREWLKRHDPELELVTHARNERIAEYVLSHGGENDSVHVLTGAAHQPGVVYYLEAYRDDDWDFHPFETVP